MFSSHNYLALGFFSLSANSAKNLVPNLSVVSKQLAKLLTFLALFEPVLIAFGFAVSWLWSSAI
jgi:hypothetical protein